MAMADNGRLSREQRQALSGRNAANSRSNTLNDVLVSKKKKSPAMQVETPKRKDVKSTPPEKERYDRVIHYDPGTRPSSHYDEERQGGQNR
ncbi:MAG: hypothetical protein IKT78_02395, partial [Ruminiclostridium sp.]|nr:hypothetical protein [Ruminiclostridium sp.]